MTNPCVKTPRMPDPLLSKLSFRLDSSGRMCRRQPWKASRRRRRHPAWIRTDRGPRRRCPEGLRLRRIRRCGSICHSGSRLWMWARRPTLLEETRRLRRPRGRGGPGDRRCRWRWRRFRQSPFGAAALRQSISHSPGSAVIRASKPTWTSDFRKGSPPCREPAGYRLGIPE